MRKIFFKVLLMLKRIVLLSTSTVGHVYAPVQVLFFRTSIF